ncbi:hypothetical protein [Myceligenerans xiligouense]|uniref:Uncharacterized protein n=1 Tax=Myceligenerans xiligouense TaxID=253184 RepID=A0A3N4ZK60_9MICO|nr:hypothetical protein [Myceligenerans xiligouense]RPF21305.1 hypothetical protein EDD34_1930 [Myceligenerans xiligouense]
MNANSQPITLKTALALSRADALMLGVHARDRAANARRLAIAQAIRQEHQQASETAYGRAAEQKDIMNEPYVPAPFGLFQLIRAAGDIQAVLDLPDFENLVLDDMGRGYRQELVSDEDGTRYETIEPGRSDLAEASYQAALTHEELRAHGLVDGEPITRTPVENALIGHRIQATGTDPHDARLFLEDLVNQYRGHDLARVLQTYQFFPTGTLHVPHNGGQIGRTLRDASEAAIDLVKERIDTAARAVAERIPCADLYAHMGDGNYATYGATFKIVFGEREPDDGHDEADIDGELDATWTFASHAHTRITTSALTLDAHPAHVATWITDQARQAASPTYLAWQARRRLAAPRLNRADRAGLTGTTPPTATDPAGSRSTGQGIEPF